MVCFLVAALIFLHHLKNLFYVERKNLETLLSFILDDIILYCNTIGRLIFLNLMKDNARMPDLGDVSYNNLIQ